jgi:hypothetical protein
VAPPSRESHRQQPPPFPPTRNKPQQQPLNIRQEKGTDLFFGFSGLSVLYFMKSHYLELRELHTSETIGFSLHGLDFIVRDFLNGPVDKQ